MIRIKGLLQHITYQNPENYYTVARLQVTKIKDPVTIVGHMPGVAEGESLEVTGTWVSHPRFGDQFKVHGVTVLLPATVSGIRKYLGSGIIKGIGRSMADRIVDHFQETTFDIIENEPEKLMQIPGIGQAKKNIIEQAWRKHHAVRKVMQFLQENEVGVFHASTILRNLRDPRLVRT